MQNSKMLRVKEKGVTYLPIYYSMFLHDERHEEPVILPELESV